jgi:hypothetical protein
MSSEIWTLIPRNKGTDMTIYEDEGIESKADQALGEGATDTDIQVLGKILTERGMVCEVRPDSLFVTGGKMPVFVKLTRCGSVVVYSIFPPWKVKVKDGIRQASHVDGLKVIVRLMSWKDAVLIAAAIDYRGSDTDQGHLLTIIRDFFALAVACSL